MTLGLESMLILKLGFDPIWFGVIQCKLLNIGMTVQPAGITRFVVAGLDKKVPMATAYSHAVYLL